MKENVINYLGATLISDKMSFSAKIKLGIADILMRFQNQLINISCQLLYKKTFRNPKRILIFRTGSLGDSVCAIPSIQAIIHTFPDSTIDILTNTGGKKLVGLHQLLNPNTYNELIDYLGYSKYQLYKMLKLKKYDLVIQLPQVDANVFRQLRDILVFRKIAPSGLGWEVSQSKLFRRTQSFNLRFPNETERLLRILSRYGIKYNMPVEKSILSISGKENLLVKNLIKKLQLEETPMICVVVGGKRLQNRWPISYFKQVINHFHSNYAILLIGSSEDNELVKPLLEISNVYNLCGKLSPMESAAIIRLCKLTISNDTGPMHLSYAVGTPTIALFSSRDLAGKWFPPKTHVVFRNNEVACQGCFTETCQNNICMQGIFPAQVISAAEDLLLTALPEKCNA